MNVIANHALRVASALLCATAAIAARADIFVLTTGGQVRGELVNREESPRQKFVVQTPEGVTVTLDRSQVKQIDPQNAAELEYEKVRPTFADTPEDQWKLAEWCRERQLTKGKQAALERVVELDPNHKQARGALGYSQVNGQWALPDQIMKDRGYIRFNGKWVLQQEIEIQKRKQQQELSVKQWLATVRTLRSWLSDPVKSSTAVAEIRAITDPNAASALAKALEEENIRETRILFVDALARIGPAGLQVLINYSLDDADKEIRYACLHHIANNPQHVAVEKYVVALKSKDNARINRAGEALGQLKDRSAIAPLIDALVTTHKFVESANPNQMSAGFSPTGGMGFTAGSSATTVSQKFSNQAVLDGLVALADGPNFGFDQRAWRTWWATQTKPAAVDTRRD